MAIGISTAGDYTFEQYESDRKSAKLKIVKKNPKPVKKTVNISNAKRK